MQFADRSFIVTGGASGLGAACARMLVAAGGKVVVADLQQPTTLADGCTFVTCDVADEVALRKAIDAATARSAWRRDRVCRNRPAARIVGRDGPHDLALFERVLRVNLVGSFNLLRLAAAAMQTNTPNADGERGIVVLTASIAYEDGQIGQAAYAASKGGVAALTLPAARELAKFGIRVVTIAPGIFETPLTTAMPDDVKKSLAAQIPFPPRLGKPGEFAALAKHAIENMALNGTVVRLDGAARMPAR